MSDFITNHFVQQYADSVDLVLQQEGSLLRPHVMVETGIKGKQKSIDFIGKIEASKIDSRHGDSPMNDINHTRRWYKLVGWDNGLPIDDIDMARTLNDPSNRYTRAQAFAMGRSIDVNTIIPAFTATLETGENPGDGSDAPLPATQYVDYDYVEEGSAVGSDLTIGKLRQAKLILDAAEVPDDDRHIAVRAQQIKSLLQQPEVINHNYNDVRALVNGEVNTFLGFQFHVVNLLANSTDQGGDGTTVRQIPVWHRTGIELGIGIDVTARVTERADKRFDWYSYYKMFLGAGRTEDERVVIIECDESEGV